MNPLIITIVIALATFILSSFTANWLNQQHVSKLMERQDKRIEDLKIYLEARSEDLKIYLDAWFDGVRQEISAVKQYLRQNFSDQSWLLYIVVRS
jgi:hypothetical protein